MASPVCSKTILAAVVSHLAVRAILVPPAAHVQRTGLAYSAVLPTQGAVKVTFSDGGLPRFGAARVSLDTPEAGVHFIHLVRRITARVDDTRRLELVVAHGRWEGIGWG